MGRRKKFRDARLGLLACKEAVKPTFYKWAKKIGTDVMDTYSSHDLTPVLTGALRSDGSFFIGDKFVGKTRKNLTGQSTLGGRKTNFGPAKELSSPPDPNSLTMTVVVNTPYAANPGFRHQYGPDYLLVAFHYALVKNIKQFGPQVFEREIRKAVKRV